MTVSKTKLAKQFADAIPHAKALGIWLDDIGAGTAEMAMPYNKEFIGTLRRGSFMAAPSLRCLMVVAVQRS